MTADSKKAGKIADRHLVNAINKALLEGALPGEIADFSDADRLAAAEYVAATAMHRSAGTALVRLESSGGMVGQRRMRLCIVNDDMPFLVDSVAAAIASKDLIIHRLLHPVVCVQRNEQGRLTQVEPLCEERYRRESIMYMEIDRADARKRQALVAEIQDTLADVRASVSDWEKLQARMHADAEALANEEGAALLHWFAGGAMTLLGHQVQCAGGAVEKPLGLLSISGGSLWTENACAGTQDYFEKGGVSPLIIKADRLSTVHRHVPLDLVIVPVIENKRITGLSIHAGLWTSQALKAPADDVPVLRRRLDSLEEFFGFDPRGHAGKALRHSIASLPRDLLVSLSPEWVKELAMTAMSLADRPRPTLMLLPSILKRHIFAFVWLPRDEVTTQRRIAIGQMVTKAAHGSLLSWSIELGDGDLALIRYMVDVPDGAPVPDTGALDRELVAMVRGWEPSVEEALGEIVGVPRATRLAIRFMGDFPESYRMQTGAAEAAQDILCIRDLKNADARGARLYSKPGDGPLQLHLKTYRLGGLIPLSEAVPVLENFGFRVLEEQPIPLGNGQTGYIHEFALEVTGGCDVGVVMQRAKLVEKAIAEVLEGHAENDVFNQLLVAAGIDSRDVVFLRAWFRYLRQIGLSYSMVTVVDALRRAPEVTKGLIALFDAFHDPSLNGLRAKAVEAAENKVKQSLVDVAAIDEDRILRLILSVILATLRTNAFVASGEEALAFKLDSSLVPGLPAPVPWREIWVYSPRVEGIHLRGGPVARGGIRWSDRRDDFRTEILGLMKAQVVKNAVIVPTGAKGGFYPKQLPPASDRDAWLAEGTEAYRIFIRALLSVTDNIVEGKVLHPAGIAVRDKDDPYFVVAADKGTATFSDVANAIAISRGFWLGDAFASGGSQGYDHKVMGITARGAWIAVQRHFAEMGVDVQTQPIDVVGCGDMSGDVFGNGMLLSKAIRLVAAFDHRHIFIDPDPDPAQSWKERERLFKLPRSSWNDYDKSLISKGGGIFPRSQKSIPLTSEMKQALGLGADEIDPASLISAILKAPVDLIWFGGIGTYVKASGENHGDVGDPGNDALRVNAAELRAKAIGEGANLGITQAGRIEFAASGGRINTDFIDNSAGVDCSDNEVNIKIPLNREMAEGRLQEADRNAFLAEMTDDVAAIVLEDNRLQTLALSIAERGGAAALPSLVRVIEILEEKGRLNRAVEGLASNETLLRRAQDNRGLTRPELAVLLSTAKMTLQAEIESGKLTGDATLNHELYDAFPKIMQERFGDAILQHRLRREIISTKIANRFVNRLGIVAPFSLTEEEGASFGQAAAAFVAAERLFGMRELWRELDVAPIAESTRLELFEQVSRALQLHIADILRSISATTSLKEMVEIIRPGLGKLDAAAEGLLREEARTQAGAIRERLKTFGAPDMIANRIVRLHELNGGIGIAVLGHKIGVDEIAITKAYTRLGEILGLDWAQSMANRLRASDQWERLLTAGLAREFEQLRLDFLERRKNKDPDIAVDQWVTAQGPRIDQFRRMVDRARIAPVATAPMLAQIAAQARVLLAR
jgi:glutamate dehydrogenase